MKMIHCADIHLGSKMEAKLPKEKADERKNEVRVSFERMVQYAKNEGVRVILLSGDVFDSDRPLKKDKAFFYSVVKNNPEIDFLYLRGNHDSEESYTESDLDNLKTFGTEWK
ncbi:MAG: metallophosphoesterase, partial [Lachnospiraceae bacterium]|nr:metallophosphoesterase [Lachnospiraceae bacterium]